MNKLAGFILKDVSNRNELKKTAVATRVCCLLMIAYLSTFIIVASVGGGISGALILGLIIVGYIFSLSMTYGSNSQMAGAIMNVVTIVGITADVIWFGWNSGIQHFLFSLVLYNILFIRMSIMSQIFTATGICIVRLALYFYCRFNTPIYMFDDILGVHIQICSTIFVFINILSFGIIYAIDNQDTENKLMKYNKELEKIASTDPLTKLWNRFKMLEHTNHFFDKNKNEMCDVCIGDIDFFKKINDTYGHEAGDEVLVQVSDLLMKEMKGFGAVARWGGEEFLFFFEHINGDEAYDKLEDIRSKINKLEIPFDGKNINVTMTFGLVEYDYSMSIDQNIKIADDRLYNGKQNGRNKIVY